MLNSYSFYRTHLVLYIRASNVSPFKHRQYLERQTQRNVLSFSFCRHFVLNELIPMIEKATLLFVRLQFVSSFSEKNKKFSFLISFSTQYKSYNHLHFSYGAHQEKKIPNKRNINKMFRLKICFP